MTEPRRSGLPSRRPNPEPDRIRHVIAEYKHRAQRITCVCGWTGSSEMLDGRTSEWSRHVSEMRQATV